MPIQGSNLSYPTDDDTAQAEHTRCPAPRQYWLASPPHSPLVPPTPIQLLRPVHSPWPMGTPWDVGVLACTAK